MTIYQPPSAQENALNTRRNHADLEAEKNSKECNNGHGLNINGDESETNDSWPADNDDEENLHHDTTPMESKAKHAAQVVLHRRSNNRHGKATNGVIGRTITADTQHPASPSSYHSRRGSPQRSFAARRRRTILYTATGLALLGYFCEMMQLIRIMGSDGGSQQDVIIDLPDSVSLPNTFNSSSNTSNAESQPLPSVASHHHVIPNKEEWDRVRAITNSRAEQRRKRCRPPNLLDANGAESVHNVPIANIESKTTAPQMTLDLPVHSSLNESIDKTYPSTSNKHIRSNTQQITAPSICGIHARDASKNDGTNYPSSAYIGPQSRVIVTGALSQLGIEIILQLYKDCGTEYILGIDSALPNTRHDRLAALERYRFLSHHVPSFQTLQVPLFGIAPHPKVGGEIRMESEFDVIDRFNPTHIVHLMGLEEGRGEYSDFGDIDDVSPYSAGGYSSMMRRYQNLVSMDQILASIARFKREQGSKAQPQLVYVSSTEVEDQSGVPLVGGMQGMIGKATVYGSCSLLKEVLASYYHRRHGVDSVGIRLSTIYGPFARPGSLLHDLAERTVHSAAGNNGDKYALETMWKRREGAEDGALEQIAYSRDLAQAFVAAMQFRGDRINGPALMQLGSKDTNSMKDIERKMSGYLPTPTKTSEPDQIAEKTSEVSTALVTTSNSLSISDSDIKRNLHLLGWSHSTETQDGLRSMLAWQIMKAYPFAQPNSVSTIKEFLDASQVPYVGLSSTLPCASGCGWHGQCTSSVWDAVVEESRAATAKCKHVLYTVDLSSDLAELNEKPATSKDEKDFCKIAFISSTSALAKQNKDSQWTIITINGDESTVTEAELSLAKLSPTMLFGDKVNHAFYADHRRLKASTDDAMTAIQSMKVDSVKEKTRVILKENAKVKKFWLLPRPKRHSIMFTSRLNTPKGHDVNSASAHASFVMSNFGVKMTKQIQKQIQFYQHASHLVRNSLLRSTNYAKYVIDNNFPFEYIRSNWLLHDLKSAEGHQLRCEIYEEHVTWGNQNMEDFSMAFVLAKRSAMMQLGKMLETPDSPGDWYPLLVPKKTKDKEDVIEGPEYLKYLDPSRKSVAKNHKGSEICISFLSHELDHDKK
eukprot:scaffold698_cov115-Skeletonema_dohrnii-CCMP3373.AAC.5